MTDWTTIVLIVDEVEVDVVAGLVWELGVSGIEERPLGDGRVELRIGCEAEISTATIAALSARWSVRSESVAADTGLDAWRDHAQVWRAGTRVVIVPPWREVPADVAASDLVLVIDPGHAFGSASHETTRLCLEAVVELMSPGAAVADIGCGSGVLAIAAARCGASTVMATDIAPEAIIATLDNVRRNEVDRLVTVSTATIGELAPASFDLVVANIGAATLRSMAEGLLGLTRPGGSLVLSGILGEQLDSVIADFEQVGAICTEVRADGEWRAAVLHRPR